MKDLLTVNWQELDTLALAKHYQALRWRLFEIELNPDAHSYEVRIEHEPTANEFTDVEEALIKRAVEGDHVACRAIGTLGVSTEFFFWNRSTPKEK